MGVCDWCERTDVEKIELRQRLSLNTWRGTGKYLYSCPDHRNRARLYAQNFAPSSEGSLADEMERQKGDSR
jgi:hypothetical protein